MIDYHCHLLPDIDDGPLTMDESMIMARLLYKAGYHTVYCTPHMIKNLYDADNDIIRNLVKVTQSRLNKENIPIKLLCGREYCIDNYFNEYLSDLMPLENTDLLLVEFLPNTYPGLVKDAIESIIRKGLVPLIAHPERYRYFHTQKPVDNEVTAKPFFFNIFSRNNKKHNHASDYAKGESDILNWLITMNCAFQNNLPSFSGVYGEAAKNTAIQFQSMGIYTHEGTDAHSPRCIERLYKIKL